MVEAYNLMNQKLQQSLYEHANLESTIRELKVFDVLILIHLIFIVVSIHFVVTQADLRRRERDYDLAQKEIVDLQKQVQEYAYCYFVF